MAHPAGHPGQKPGAGGGFITSRAIQRRLDETVGPFHWKTEFSPWHQIGNGSQLCALSIYDEERKEWVTKTDGAENSDIEPMKGGLSDSFKRAAVQQGRQLVCLRPGNDPQLAQGICLRNVRLNQQRGRNNEVVNLLEGYEIAA